MPIPVVAEATAEQVKEETRQKGPLPAIDRAREDAVVARLNRSLERSDVPWLALHQPADQALVVPEGADAEQPHSPAGERVRFRRTNFSASGNQR